MFRYLGLPYYAPEGEVGSGEAGSGGGAPPITPNEQQQDGPGSGRSDIRRELEKGFKEARDQEAKRATPAKDPKTGQFVKGGEAKPAPKRGVNHQVQEQVIEPDEELDEVEVAEAPEGEEQEQVQVEAAPKGISKEATAEWAKTPPSVRQAFLKRIEDMDKGVAQLKQNYAEIDQVLAPRMQVIRQHGHTPAAAVNQMFAWFDALTQNPDQAFPALAHSFRYDLRRLLGNGQQQQQGGQQQQEQQDDLSPAVKQLLENQFRALEQKFGTALQQRDERYQSDNIRKSNDLLAVWSKDKPYFEEVRQYMAHLIGSGAVPTLPNGDADLDSAYDQAIFAIPAVREKVLEEQKQARIKALKEKREKEAAAQAAQAAKAQRASGSLAPGAPSDEGTNQQGKKKRKTVRESLNEAIETARGN